MDLGCKLKQLQARCTSLGTERNHHGANMLIAPVLYCWGYWGFPLILQK